MRLDAEDALGGYRDRDGHQLSVTQRDLSTVWFEDRFVELFPGLGDVGNLCVKLCNEVVDLSVVVTVHVPNLSRAAAVQTSVSAGWTLRYPRHRRCDPRLSFILILHRDGPSVERKTIEPKQDAAYGRVVSNAYAPARFPPFGARLAAAIELHGQLTIGIDPHRHLLRDWRVPENAEGAERFGRTIVAAVAGTVPMVKLQSAFFEQFGSSGVVALERVIRDAREAGLLVLLDAKRGDVESTNEGYALAYLGAESSARCDALTVHPYLGWESLTPFFDAARQHNAGVFVLAFTSNADARSVQRARVDGGQEIGRLVLARLTALNLGLRPLGSFGAVVGATVEREGEDYGIGGPILAPGYSAQGGSLEGLTRLFRHDLSRVLPSTSRGFAARGPDARALTSEAIRESDALREAVARFRVAGNA